MKRNRTSRIARVLVASSVVFGAAAAHAATGYDISHGQESMVRPGMTMAQVQQALGSPDQTMHYADQLGPTWRYHVMNAAFPGTYFSINFGANGKVASDGQNVADLG